MTDTLSALLAPTRSMYGADALPAASTPAALPAVQPPTSPTTAPSSTGTILGGLAIATGVAAGVSALVGSVMYPNTKTREFAAVGALAYAIPAGILVGTTLAIRSKSTGIDR